MSEVDPLTGKTLSPLPEPSPFAPNAPLPPAPPGVSTGARLGSKTSFLALLASFGLIAFGWQWRRAGPEDWAAGTLILAVLPAALTFGDRRSSWRRALGAAACAGSLFCWSRHVLVTGGSVPVLEAAIVLGVGVCALLGSTYLGQWGEDRSEVVWARALGPTAGLCLLAAALAWSVPETSSWTVELAARTLAWWGQFTASGGGWRWLGTAGVGGALATAVHLRVQTSAAPKDRTLNWNK